MNGELVLVPEVQARRALRGQHVRVQVLVPNGAWIGCGVLRVLRLKMGERSLLRQAQDDVRQAQDDIAQDDKEVQLTVGYESYQSSAPRGERTSV